MHPTERFERSPLQRQPLIQQGCPVYVHCFCRCTDRKTGASFVQVRMVNRAAWTVRSVRLSVRCLDAAGNVCGVKTALLAGLSAASGTVFGEERLLPLGTQQITALTITVEHIVFDGGMRWKRPTGQDLLPLEAVGWRRCACGLPNPPDAECCPLCGRPTEQGTQADAVTAQQGSAVTQSQAETAEAVPASESDAGDPAAESADDWQTDDAPWEEAEDAPRWMTVLLCLLAALALLAIAAVATLSVWRRVG